MFYLEPRARTSGIWFRHRRRSHVWNSNVYLRIQQSAKGSTHDIQNDRLAVLEGSLWKVQLSSDIALLSLPTYSNSSISISPDPLGQLHVFRHDGHPLGMDGTEVGVLKEPNNVGLHSLLESGEGGGLDAEGGGILQHQTPGKSLERQMRYREILLPKKKKKIRSSSFNNTWKGNFLMSSSVDFW